MPNQQERVGKVDTLAVLLRSLPGIMNGYQ